MTGLISPWFIVSVGVEISIAGICYDHSRKRIVENQTEFEDGHRIVTSRLVSINNNMATTITGSLYSLGERGTEEFFNEKKFGESCRLQSFDLASQYEIKE